ncbi:unnamed protein product [Ectocarpus fasciculatus]
MILARSLVGVLLALAGRRSADAFAVGGASRHAIGRRGAFSGAPVASTVSTIRPEMSRVRAASPSRGSARMLAGQEFATCSEADFRAYIIGWTFVWSGIIPYTFIASKNVLGAVIGFKSLSTVKEGEDATISNQSLLLYKDPIKLLDIVNIVGRFQTFDDVQNKKGGVMSDYLFRNTFKENLRRSKFKGWPAGPDGQPALKDAFGGDVKAVTRTMAKRELSESAMNAVFDSFVGSPLSLVADRFKVDNQLDNWRKDNTFDIKGFEQGLLVGRLLFLFTIVSLVGLLLAGYGVFFVQPIIIRYGNPLEFLGF